MDYILYIISIVYKVCVSVTVFMAPFKLSENYKYSLQSCVSVTVFMAYSLQSCHKSYVACYTKSIAPSLMKLFRYVDHLNVIFHLHLPE